MKKFVDDYTFLRIRFKGELNRISQVELYDATTNECLNAKVCELMGHSIPNFAMIAEKRWKFDDLINAQIITNSPTEIMILDNGSTDGSVTGDN